MHRIVQKTYSFENQKFTKDLPSGVEDSFLRLEGGASRLIGVGWCSGERTMADMMICCLAVAGVDGWGWSDIFRWAATDEINITDQHNQYEALVQSSGSVQPFNGYNQKKNV